MSQFVARNCKYRFLPSFLARYKALSAHNQSTYIGKFLQSRPIEREIFARLMRFARYSFFTIIYNTDRPKDSGKYLLHLAIVFSVASRE